MTDEPLMDLIRNLIATQNELLEHVSQLGADVAELQARETPEPLDAATESPGR